MPKDYIYIYIYIYIYVCILYMLYVLYILYIYIFISKVGDKLGRMYVNIFLKGSVGLFQKHFASISETSSRKN